MINEIDENLFHRVIELRDTFCDILDDDGENLNGALRVKMAKAELLLNRVALLIKDEIDKSRKIVISDEGKDTSIDMFYYPKGVGRVTLTENGNER